MISKERLLHLCFNEEDFKVDNFVPAKFLVQKRRHVSLDILQKDLRTYLEHLKEEVVQLINTDLYDNFLSVSNKLAGIDVELTRICEPLPEMMGKVDKAKKKLEDSRSIVQQKLLECKEIDSNRQFYVHVLKMTVMADKVEDWLDAHTEGISEDEDLNAFTRMAVECQQLSVNENLCKATNPDQEEEKLALLGRTRHLRKRFDDLLNNQFTYALRQQQELVLQGDYNLKDVAKVEQQLQVHLECYQVLQKEAEVATLFQNNVCKEVVDKVLSWTATGNHRNAAPEAVQPLFQELLADILRHCMPLVHVAHRVAGEFHLIKAIWKCAMDVILKRMQHIFSPGIPAKFHAHYVASQKLLAGLEAHIADTKELQDFRHSEEMEAWNSKWLLSVYTALRQKEAMAELNSTLQHHLQPHTSELVAETGYNFVQVQAVHKLLFWLWGDDVYLYAVGDQLVKVTLRTVIALQKWMAQFWDAPPPPEPAPLPPQVTTDEDGNTVTIPAEPPEKKNLGLLAADMKLKDYVALYCDLIRLQDQLAVDLQQKILQQMLQPGSSGDAPLAGAIKGLCVHCSQLLGVPLGTVKGFIVGSVAKECIDTLVSPLKSITSLYRMTKKPVPKRFSFFIPTILTGLVNFKDACKSSGQTAAKFPLPPEVVEECIQGVLAEVTNSYYREAKALLITARKAEKAVSALRKKQKKTEDDKANEQGEGKEEMSDTDKIFVQIYLDIQEYGHQAGINFGMAKDFGPYVHLCALVQRAAWLLGEISEEPADTLEE